MRVHAHCAGAWRFSQLNCLCCSPDLCTSVLQNMRSSPQPRNTFVVACAQADGAPNADIALPLEELIKRDKSKRPAKTPKASTGGPGGAGKSTGRGRGNAGAGRPSRGMGGRSSGIGRGRPAVAYAQQVSAVWMHRCPASACLLGCCAKLIPAPRTTPFVTIICLLIRCLCVSARHTHIAPACFSRPSSANQIQIQTPRHPAPARRLRWLPPASVRTGTRCLPAGPDGGPYSSPCARAARSAEHRWALGETLHLQPRGRGQHR
jgi:hypothetical protein